MAQILDDEYYEDEDFEVTPVTAIELDNSDEDEEETKVMFNRILKRKQEEKSNNEDSELRKILREKDEESLCLTLEDLKKNIIFHNQLIQFDNAKQRVKDFKKILDKKTEEKKSLSEKASNLIDKACQIRPTFSVLQNPKMRKTNEGRMTKAKEFFLEALYYYDMMKDSEKHAFMLSQSRNQDAILLKKVKLLKPKNVDEEKIVSKKKPISSKKNKVENDKNEMENPLDDEEDEIDNE